MTRVPLALSAAASVGVARLLYPGLDDRRAIREITGWSRRAVERWFDRNRLRAAEAPRPSHVVRLEPLRVLRAPLPELRPQWSR